MNAELTEIIELADAQIEWTPERDRPDNVAGVTVFSRSAFFSRGCVAEKGPYASCGGAGNPWWARSAKSEPVKLLMEAFKEVAEDGVSLQEVHREFMNIREYRQLAQPERSSFQPAKSRGRKSNETRFKELVQALESASYWWQG
jgi:hypothetical protein